MAAEQTPAQPTLSGLLAGLLPVPPGQDCEVTSLTLDSRQVVDGAIFLACTGTRHHGLAFARQAMAQGAEVILWEPDNAEGDQLAADLIKEGFPLLAMPKLSVHISEIAARFYGDPSQHLTVFGVTGTNGKTSVCQLLAQALQNDGPCGIMGTLGYGFPSALESTGFTTPDAVTVQRLLTEMWLGGAKTVSMEVSSHALDQGRAAAVHFTGAIFTNLSRDHFDYHGSFENYAAAKQRLFQMPGLESAVINIDDAQGASLLNVLSNDVETLVYSLKADAELPDGLSGWARAIEITPTTQGMEIRIATHRGEGLLKTRLLGRFNAANLLAVLLVLLQRDWDLSRALRVMVELTTVPGRMQLFTGDEKPSVVVDYAHTPDALEKALQATRVHCDGRLFVVFGCGGDRDRGKRPQMGALAEQLADVVFVTDDNPRSESSAEIIQQILAGMHQPEATQIEGDRGLAIRRAIEMARPGDMVLVAGKGHEDYQLIGEQVLHFDDREQVTAALAEWREAGE
ncbi:MAG: UDP-N-acetylmuramoyl-L-alanyl-D-glutamate--2,6-diaminopimelate ligase [Candidatus Thiodiazotropha sp. (ex Myrtea spinifera)]|nr:UDP-N-acetylmuramoyl-L-alanyl-D-glutamate--2,6-diaminopimelate ligase [Candidatus Thiodiazotropha sp. (ex Myrtea spinifera)]MCU7827864.1 UDP-N-acetylmuramoyl-L-alanyl-D-glutamate--2,6-diaminopimelate ligase [Candidatus Thiodiazotropha sp. (ex Myrtea sp. 'scaly one' KF741663)]